jgi:hypothetical protein
MALKTRLFSALTCSVLIASAQACMPAQLTPEQEAEIASLKGELSTIRADVEQAKKEDAALSAGLVKTLIAVRLEILRTNEALIQQRIHALESGASVTVVLNATDPDPLRAAELLNEIEIQKAKLADARQEANRYSGGLVQVMSLAAAATTANTLAFLEQEYFAAKYGLALPRVDSAAIVKPAGAIATMEPAAQASEGSATEKLEDCLKIQVVDSSVLDSNDVFTELAWKVDVASTCEQPYPVRVRFVVSDRDDFELADDDEVILVPAGGISKARGKMLVHPPEKARRMATQGASLTLQ